MGTGCGYTTLKLEDTHSYSMAYDPDTNFLVLADSTNGGALYYIDLNSPDYAWGNYPSGSWGTCRCAQHFLPSTAIWICASG